MTRGRFASMVLAVVFLLNGYSWALAADTVGPATQIFYTTPSEVRATIDSTMTILARVSDVSSGNSNIAAAEYFVGDDPGPGNGTPMSAYNNGVFDSPLVVATAVVDVSNWTSDTLIYARGKDVFDNWGPASSYDVTVTDDATPPGRILDLAAKALGSLRALTVTVSGRSSQQSGHPVTAILDNDSSTSWRTIGSARPEREYVIIDAIQSATINAVTLANGDGWRLFPTNVRMETSTDGSTWQAVASASVKHLNRLKYLYQFEPVTARYIRISGPAVRSSTDKKYYWDIADVAVYTSAGMLIQLNWTAPADDGYLGAAADHYDGRYSASAIESTADWANAGSAVGFGSPVAPGPDAALVNVSLESTQTTAHIAMETYDAAGNCSAMSNVATVNPTVSGFAPIAPDDQEDAAVADGPVFSWRTDPAATSVSIDFSGSNKFPPESIIDSTGMVQRSASFPVSTKKGQWQPSRTQWKAIRAVASPESGTLFWRLEGATGPFVGVFGPTRRLLFPSDEIKSLAVNPAQTVDSTTDALLPDKGTVPEFSWVNAGTDMKYFTVDVSTSPLVPVNNPAKTIVLGGRGVTADSYPNDTTSATQTALDWRRIRQLATKGGGTLYWRVRGTDAERALVSVSNVTRRIIMNAGTWGVLPPQVDLSTGRWTLTWTHDGSGITRYQWQFSGDSGFSTSAGKTLALSVSPLSASPHPASDAEMSRIRAFISANSLTDVWYRVRGTDSDGAFVTYSAAASFTP